MKPAIAAGLLGAIRRLKSKAPIKKLVAELYPDVNLNDEIEIQCFILAIDAIGQTLKDFEEGPDAEYYAESIEWCNENEASLPFDRVCGQLRMNERQARMAIAAMFPGLQASGTLSILKPKSIEVLPVIRYAAPAPIPQQTELEYAWYSPMARMEVFTVPAQGASA